MAGTVLLPVRGRSLVLSLAGLVIAGLITGGLVGAIIGLVLSPVPEPSSTAVVAIMVVVAVLDAGRSLGVRVLDAGRQVPLAWGRLFSAPVAAGLYGARLGVGPATILTTWSWWGAVILSGLAGPGTGALTGMLFHLARVATMIVATAGGAGPERMATLDRLDRPGRIAGIAAVLLTAVLA